MSSADLTSLLGGPAVEVAPRLLGMELSTSIGGRGTSIRLTEVEAYRQDDPASHTYRGKTSRNAPMFEGGGAVYVYRSYGIHWCVNLVTGPPGRGEAVLIRGGVPVDGIDVMMERRRRADHLTDGPGKVCQALGIDGSMSGSALGTRVDLSGEPGTSDYFVTPRIGITKAIEQPWRFVAGVAHR